MPITMIRKGIRKRMVSIALAGLAVVPASASACPDESVTPPALTVEAARASTLCLINERRKKFDLKKLRRDPRLDAAAQAHSDSMNTGEFFDHDSPTGGSLVDRVRQAGFLTGASAWGIAENIRWGNGGWASPRIAVRDWMQSPPHRHAMLDGHYRLAGIGVSIGSPTGADSDAAIYTADFGYRK